MFTKVGIGRGDTVVLILKRHYEFWFALLGLHKIGAVGIPATNLLTKKDLVYRFNAAHVKGIICTTDGGYGPRGCGFPESPTVKVKIGVHGAHEGWLDFMKELENQPDTFEQVETAATNPMLLYFTSGTTGMPKMVWHDYTYPIAHIVTAKYWHNVVPDGLHLTLSDTGWIKRCGASSTANGSWRQVSSSAILISLPLLSCCPVCQIPDHHVLRAAHHVPVFIKEDLNKYDLSSIRHATIAGEPLNPEVFNQFYKATGLKLMEGFGQTETT